MYDINFHKKENENTNVVSSNKDKFNYDNIPQHIEQQPTYYANTSLFSRRLLRRRPKTTGPICKEVLKKDK
jgi:hypothetical protein